MAIIRDDDEERLARADRVVGNMVKHVSDATRENELTDSARRSAGPKKRAPAGASPQLDKLSSDAHPPAAPASQP